MAYLLGKNSIYIRIPEDIGYKKTELVRGVAGAIIIYLLLALISLWRCLRSSAQEPEDKFDKI